MFRAIGHHHVLHWFALAFIRSDQCRRRAEQAIDRVRALRFIEPREIGIVAEDHIQKLLEAMILTDSILQVGYRQGKDTLCGTNAEEVRWLYRTPSNQTIRLVNVKRPCLADLVRFIADQPIRAPMRVAKSIDVALARLGDLLFGHQLSVCEVIGGEIDTAGCFVRCTR